MCPPGLHITLGIFYRLFTLMENECDLDVVGEDSIDEGGVSWGQRLKQVGDDLERWGGGGTFNVNSVIFKYF